jgi:hypothetical protein
MKEKQPSLQPEKSQNRGQNLSSQIQKFSNQTQQKYPEEFPTNKPATCHLYGLLMSTMWILMSACMDLFFPRNPIRTYMTVITGTHIHTRLCPLQAPYIQPTYVRMYVLLFLFPLQPTYMHKNLYRHFHTIHSPWIPPRVHPYSLPTCDPKTLGQIT